MDISAGINKKSLNLSGLGLMAEIGKANFLAPSLPYKITLALTYRCNLKCKYCQTWARPVVEELSLNNIKLLFDSAVNLRWLQLTGGEIFLRNDIGDILSYAVEKQKLAILTFPTNGILSDKICRTVESLSAGLGGTKLVITCSLDGTQATHDRLRGANGTYEKCLETFSRLRTFRGVKAYLGVTVSRDNYRDIPSLFEDLQQRIEGFTFDELHFNFAAAAFFYDNMQKGLSPEPINNEIYQTIDSFRRRYRRDGIKNFLENRYFELMKYYIEDKKCPVTCGALHNSCFIDPYGDVYPCISYEEKIGNLAVCGYDLEKFWQQFHEKKDKVRAVVAENKCPGCWTPCEAYPSILTSLMK